VVILGLLACLHDFPDRHADFDADGIPADEDCDDTDPKIGAASLWYIDADGDGHGGDESLVTCRPASNAVTSTGDCDDTDVLNFVGNEEVCDQSDNDCNGQIDDVTQPSPGIVEVCGDGIDNNCDGSCNDCCFHSEDKGGNEMAAAWFALFSTEDVASLGRAIVATDDGSATASFAAGGPREEVVFVVPAATLLGDRTRIDVDDPHSETAIGVVHGSVNDGYFGTALATIDGTGMLVSAPGAQELVDSKLTNGAVYRLDDPITAGQELTVDHNDVAFYATGGTAPTYFGSAMLTGHAFTEDGTQDVVVSGVNEAFEGTEFSTGAVWVFYEPSFGSPSRSDIITGREPEDGFGTAIAAGDVNGDDVDDLLIGKGGPQAPAPAVCVFLGGEPFGSITDGYADFSFTSLTGGANLGASLALGDFDSDGSMDVAAGAPVAGDIGTDNATVHLYLNDDDWKKGRDISLDEDDMTFVGTAIDRTGSALVARDLDLDGVDDLLIGSPGVASGGLTYLVRMPQTGGVGPNDVAAKWSIGAPDAELGFELGADRFDEDAWPDVLLAAPGDRAVFLWKNAGP
jgi:hypothetical protein